MFTHFFKLISIVCALCFAHGANAASWCKMDGDIKVSIIPSESPIKHDYSKSFLELSKIGVSSANPYGPKAITHTFGVANGQFKITHKVRLQMLTNPNTKQTCMWYDSIDVNIDMSPVIMVAKEYRKGGCHFQQVYAHELEHIQVDRQVVNEYAKILGQKLLTQVNRRPLIGPFRTSLSTSKQKQMQDRLNTIVRRNNDEMMRERTKRQALVDSKENYDKVSDMLHSVCDKKSPLTADKVNELIRMNLNR